MVIDCTRIQFRIVYIKEESNYSDHLSRDLRQINQIIVTRKEDTKQIDRKKRFQLIVYYHDSIGHGSAKNFLYNKGTKYYSKGYQ